MKYIVVIGGVLSGIGKGMISSSIGFLLRSYGLKVTCIKIDPYLNIDAGTLSPLDHGEVFVLDDGGEVDLDLGNYERFLDITLNRDSNITTGKIYSLVVEQERKGNYLGKTVQVVPHVTDEIQNWITRVSEKPTDLDGSPADVCIVEMGGTIGDIESAPFIEALRQFQFKVGKNSFCLVLVSLVPVMGSVGEQKTKPTQACVRDLRALGLNPDIITCRSSRDLADSTVSKIVNFCHVNPSDVFSVKDCSSVYELPILLKDNGIVNVLNKKLDLGVNTSSISPMLTAWTDMCNKFKTLKTCARITIVGKYTNLRDSYISLIKAVEHASIATEIGIELVWIEATDLEELTKTTDYEKYTIAWDKLCNTNAVIIPGGFGERGISGMIAAASYCRVNKVPLLGICLGMQVMAIEFARSVLKMTDAYSEEFAPDNCNNVIIRMPNHYSTKKGATMKLGAYDVPFNQNTHNTKLYRLYKKPVIRERFRNRFAIDPKLNSAFTEHGLTVVSSDITYGYTNLIELNDHPLYIGSQYHAEYVTRPLLPSPCFVGIVHAANGTLQSYLGPPPT